MASFQVIGDKTEKNVQIDPQTTKMAERVKRPVSVLQSESVACM